MVNRLIRKHNIPERYVMARLVKEAINDILKATGSELQIDTDELVRDLKEIFLVDKAEAVLEEKKAIRAEKMKHKEKDEEALLQEMIFMDDDKAMCPDCGMHAEKFGLTAESLRGM